MGSEIVEKLRAAVRDVPDFPKKGIVFKDITPVLNDPVLFRASIDLFLERCRGKNVDKIVGIDARGFLFGSAVAYELGLGFVPIRKRGKLPYRTDTAKYSLEYGEAEMEMTRYRRARRSADPAHSARMRTETRLAGSVPTPQSARQPRRKREDGHCCAKLFHGLSGECGV